MRKTIIAMILLVTGCSSPEVIPDAPVIKYQPNDSAPVSIYVPRFYVVTPENVDKLLGEKKVLIAVSYDDSIELTKSISDVNTFVKKQNETIIMLRK